MAKKIELHLNRFVEFYRQRYGHDRISTCLQRDVIAWLQYLETEGNDGAPMKPNTINNHLASLSAFTTWVCKQAPDVFPVGDPVKGIGEYIKTAPEPRALTEEKVRTLKNLCDRLPRLCQLKGRRHSRSGAAAPVHQYARPWRDRAIVFVLLSTGLRREELVNLDLDQVEPNTPEALRAARRARITRVLGKGKTERTVWLSADARAALADYLERERPLDATEDSRALFLSAHQLPARAKGGRLSCRAVNLILAEIGRLHDAEFKGQPERCISPLHPHALRHTFAYLLAKETNADAFELQRRLGHRSQKYIQLYTNPPEEVSARIIEKL